MGQAVEVGAVDCAVQVILGKHHFYGRGEGHTYQAKKVLKHERWRSDIKTNDIGLVRLDREVELQYRPICLAGPDTVLTPGERLLATGGREASLGPSQACRLGHELCARWEPLLPRGAASS